MRTKQFGRVSVWFIHLSLLGIIVLYNNCSGNFEVDTEKTQLALESFSAPTIEVTSAPPTISNQRSGTIEFQISAGTVLGIRTAECQIDTAAPVSCVDGVFRYSDLDDGDHNVRILVENNRGLKADEVTLGFRIDATNPTIQLLTSPATITGSTSADFSIRAADALSAITRIECAKDDGSQLNPQFAVCNGTLSAEGLVDHRLQGLAAGPHRLRVRAFDAAGNSSEVIQHQWQVDLSAPTIEILEPRPAPVSNMTNVSLSFRASDDGVPIANLATNFECQLNSGAWTPCTSPAPYAAPAVTQGSQTFRVRARDRAGNLSQPESLTWIVDSTAPNSPNITTTIASPTRATTASFSFTASDQASGAFLGSGVTRYECRFDNGSFLTCTSPTAFPPDLLVPGGRAFHVRAIDAAGNTSAVRSFEFVVDRTPPTVNLTVSRSAPHDTSARFDFSANDNVAVAGLRCSHNGSTFATCTSPHSLSNLARITHTFEVQATDTAGNTSVARQDFTVAAAPTPTPTPAPTATPAPTPTATPPPNGSTVTARLAVTRIRGPAPLAVMFNAAASRDTDAVTVDTFKDLSYSFDAGDGNTATYAITGMLKRRHSGGPLFAYVYETPRATPYVAQVRVQNARGVWSDATVEITVEDPNVTYAGTNTICVGSTMPVAGQGGCPIGAATRTTLPSSTEYTGKRVLLRRGDSFGSVSTFTNTNDAQVGAFGTGAAPNVSSVFLGGNPSGTPGDHPSRVSVMDLNVTGSMANNASGDDLLYLRMRMSSTAGYFEAGGSAGGYWRSNLPSGWSRSHIPMARRIFVFEGVFDGNASYGFFIDGAIVGSTFHANPPNQHAFRAWGAVRSYFGHNLYGRVGDSIRHSFKMHSGGTTACVSLDVENITSDQCATSQVVMANNIFGSASNPNSWTLAIRPENTESPQGIEDFIVENNMFVPSPGTNTDILLVGRRMVERGNVRSNGSGLLSNTGGTSTGNCTGYPLPGSWCGPYFLRAPALPANYP